MVTTPAQPASRYRRRILALGALATGALYVIGAPIFASRIESDLESRVPAELAAAGFPGVTASFSGQDGTLTCESPLDDPEGARSAAYDVKGVRAIELDRSCRVNTAAALTDEDATVDQSSGVDDETADVTAGTAASSTTTASTETTESSESATETELATVQDVVAANPDLAFLSVLLADTDIGRSDTLITLFAPSNAAFDAVPADVLSRLQNDPVLLEQVLDHHVVEGALMSSDLVDGDLVAEDGTMLPVVVGDEITVGGGTLVETDIIASNGIVHVIDTVLAPDEGVDEPDVEPASLTIDYDGQQVMLTGVVASEVERQVLVAAATEAAGADFVTDDMTTDPDTGAGTEVVERLAQVVASMPSNLVSASAGTDGEMLYVTGVARNPAGRDAMFAVATEADVSADLTDAPDATTDDATELEAQLNAFVAENPILFEPSSDVLADSAVAVIDRVAADASAFDGLEITVEGHTDSDGIPIENLQLSQDRAEAVRAALVERGLDPDAVTAVGFGSEQPVLVDGVEDKAASRRVEFRVVATA
jgi:OOP family OmpA-OmpF porin